MLPSAESLSGDQPVTPVVRAHTAEPYMVLTQAEVAGYGGSICISNGYAHTYSLTFVTSNTQDQYDPEMVIAILRADAEKPEATFSNVIDMMEWLERD